MEVRADCEGMVLIGLLSDACLVYHSFTALDRLPKDGSAHGGLSPFTPVNNQDNFSHKCHRPV